MQRLRVQGLSLIEAMLHRFAHILCLLALLVQVASGALPPGFSCIACGVEPATPEKCCCDRCGQRSEREPSCCCPIGAVDERGGCDDCLRIRTPERDTTATTRVVADEPSNCPVAILPSFEMVWDVDSASPCRTMVPRPNESPPNLRFVCTTRLIV